MPPRRSGAPVGISQFALRPFERAGVQHLAQQGDRHRPHAQIVPACRSVTREFHRYPVFHKAAADGSGRWAGTAFCAGRSPCPSGRGPIHENLVFRVAEAMPIAQVLLLNAPHLPHGLNRAGFCRRLQLLRKWSRYEQDNKQIFTRSPRPSSSDGFGSPRRIFLAMGNGLLDRCQDRLHGADAQ
ncbi:hypothetical protein EV129_104516 [Rhizobium azibense]|uniref:Uncharacterized protein n=1 Tax=Rhizobium azibense TaxID=1136135 RepID=A0A4R3S3P5_9HYPH|nr:hypothetical protein EV129_104516 [Rhizobium azibense]